jgi:hypothetical protein
MVSPEPGWSKGGTDVYENPGEPGAGKNVNTIIDFDVCFTVTVSASVGWCKCP